MSKKIPLQQCSLQGQSCKVEPILDDTLSNSELRSMFVVQFHLTQGQLLALKHSLDSAATVRCEGLQAELAFFFNNALIRAGIDMKLKG